MNYSVRRKFLIGLMPLLLCGLLYGQSTQPAPKFLRFVPDDRGGGVLQTSVVTYRNSSGATVDLIAAVHVADAEYFRQLNKDFEQYDSLLYELIKPKDMEMRSGPVTRPAPGGARPLAWVGVLQNFLTDVLSLSFQLDEIDYSKRNFVHADLDVETFQRLQADRGESIFTLMLQQMLRELSRTSNNPNAPELDLAGLILALQSPDRARQLKLVLARTFNEMEDMMAGLGGPNGTVILTERNRVALTILRKRLDAGDRKIGIFYGAGHLNEMEKDLTGLMGFKQVGEPKWRDAWNMTAPTTRPAAIRAGG